MLDTFRDYERSINAEGKDKLIFLYRAVEEILWHYFLKSNPNSDDRNPSPSSCAKALELGHDPSKREKWISEFTTLAHERGRHSEGRPYTHKLPASLNDCILAAEKRVGPYASSGKPAT